MQNFYTTWQLVVLAHVLMQHHDLQGIGLPELASSLVYHKYCVVICVILLHRPAPEASKIKGSAETLCMYCIGAASSSVSYTLHAWPGAPTGLEEGGVAGHVAGQCDRECIVQAEQRQ